MNKKFLSAILFGALTVASTSTFVSCKDYDDDIDYLQEQIDQNATTAASDLAAKVAALESQLGTLNAAKESLAAQLATAKSEAAAAAANALAAAQAAQTAADAAKAGGDAAAAAAAAAQRVADQAVADLAAAVARVATLETKVTNLEAITNELKVANVELNAKVSDLQTQMTAVKADTKANADAIAAANAQILAKYSELSNEISKLSSSLGARIDVIDATLNTIQANYATKDELNTKAQELAAMDAQLKAQIEANLKYIETLQATVKDLASKDAELAGKIESNFNTLLEKVNAITVEQTSMLKSIEALQTTVATLNASYSTLASAKADVAYVDNINTQLTTLITSLQKTLNDLTTSDASQASTINTLLQDVSKLKEDVLNLQKKADAAATKDELTAAVADLQKKIDETAQGAATALEGEVSNLKAAVDTNAADIEAIKETLATKADQSELDGLAADLILTQASVTSITEGLATIRGDIATQRTELEGMIAQAETNAKGFAQELVDALDERLTDAEELLTQLTGIAGEDLSAFITSDALATELENYITTEDFESAFEAEKEALAEEFASLTEDFNTFKTDVEARIEAEVAKLEGVNEALVTLKSAVEVLNNQMEALLKRIQSVVFIPQYRDTENTVIAPVYNYAPNVYNYNYSTNRAEGPIAKPNPRVEMKFRVQPAEAADMLVSTFTKADVNNYMKLYVEKALETRAADQSVATIESVAKDTEAGVIVVTAKISVNGIINDEYRPTTLVIGSDLYKTTDEDGNETTISSDDVKLRITTEYFNLKGIEYSTLNDVLVPEDDVYGVDAAGQYEIPYTDINVTHYPWEEAYVAINGLPVNVTNWGYNTNLKVWNGTIVQKNDGTQLITGSYRVKDNAGNDKWSNFVNAAKTAGFVLDSEGKFKMDKSTGGSAIIDNVGNTMTLTLMDETFGYASNGTPNKTYQITYIIAMPDDADAYDFGNFARTWVAGDADNDGINDGSEGFAAWSNDNTKDHKFSAGTQSLRQFNIKDSKGNSIKAATPAELAVALNDAITAGNIVYTITDNAGNVVTDATNITPVLTIDTRNYKANLNVDFGQSTKYETKHIEAKVTTDYGVVVFTADANLSYPTDFLVHEPRWTNGKFNVEAGNQVVSYRDGLVGSSLDAGYTNYEEYKTTGVVQYEFVQVQSTYWENRRWYTPNNVSIGSEYSADNYLKLLATPTAGTSNDVTDYVKVKVTVKVDGHDATGEEFYLNVKYPLEGMEVTSGEQTIPAATLINNQTVSVIQNVTLNDRYGNELFKNGVAVPRDNTNGGPATNAEVWGITGLTYNLNRAISASGHEVSTVSVSPNGQVSIVDPNISEDITVTIDVETVDYNYNAVKGSFDVIIKATY